MNNKIKNDIDTGFYSFVGKDIYAQSLIHLINLYLPKNSIMVEVGTGYGQSSCMIAQHCQNINKIYTIDPYLPYTTSFEISTSFGKKEVDNVKIISEHNIRFSGVAEKINLLTVDSKSALLQFDEDSIDLLFYDATQSSSVAFNDISSWYKKVKSNGIVAGHCWSLIKDSVLKFKNSIDNNNILSVHDDVWAFIKK